jgi:hypothetical protein
MSLLDIGANPGSKIPRPVSYAVTSLLSIALYNVIELSFLLFATFKRRNGPYFWSFLVATWGIAFYVIGFILKDFSLAPRISYFYVTFIILGWCAMVTGQSMVLYSRLHLVVRRRAILRSVLAMIIVDAIILHIPTIVLCYGANSPRYRRFAVPYAVYERVQVTVFFVQESLISILYMYETCMLMYSGGSFTEGHGEAGRRLLLHLICVNITVILLDIAILVLQFTGRYASQTAAKGLIYSVKLKLEYDILNRLVELTRRPSDSNSGLIYGGSPGYMGRHVQESGGQADCVQRHRQRHCSCPWAIFAHRVKELNYRPGG